MGICAGFNFCVFLGTVVKAAKTVLADYHDGLP